MIVYADTALHVLLNFTEGTDCINFDLYSKGRHLHFWYSVKMT